MGGWLRNGGGKEMKRFHKLLWTLRDTARGGRPAAAGRLLEGRPRPEPASHQAGRQALGPGQDGRKEGSNGKKGETYNVEREDGTECIMATGTL